jgi:hypothetical protein
MKTTPFVRAVEQLENGDIVLDHIFEAAGSIIRLKMLGDGSGER